MTQPYDSIGIYKDGQRFEREFIKMGLISMKGDFTLPTIGKNAQR